MNCCEHENDKRHHENKHRKHMLMMLVCCGLPVLILILLPLISGSLPGIASILGSIAPFLCPMMIGMMFFMNRSGKNESAYQNSNETKQIKE